MTEFISQLATLHPVAQVFAIVAIVLLVLGLAAALVLLVRWW